MKRKVIQIADSTQLVSIPRPWGRKYNIKKGDELEVTIKGNKLEVSTSGPTELAIENLDISQLGSMILRCLMAFYKRGVDELHITYDNEKLIEIIHKAIGKEAAGYEIIDQGKGRCTIKYVTGELGDFDSILSRTFLILINMANETYDAIEKKNYDRLNNVAFLEEANNRFTTACRRLINKKGYDVNNSVGALYYIIEELENLADYYKYLCLYMLEHGNEKTKISKDTLELLRKTNTALRLFYECFYKFDRDKIVQIGELRKEVITEGLELMTKKQGEEIIMLHHVLTIMQKTFCLVGPYLVIKL
ncbi:AbrB/MazE/SpoVT family DNA-binding domain-containing protein [Candidatus Woesearchaeota archaeon]|nr:AbrB/MazE/SpoVT family DNA-binding domain-containing protein [Candidatus Woesearchaeota archaeon]